MLVVVHFIAVLTAVSASQEPTGGILQEALNIFSQGVIQLWSCNDTRVNVSEISFTLYTRQLQAGIRVDNGYDIDPSIKTIFIIHGWLQKGTQEWVTKMKDAYLNQRQVNVVVVNWSKYANTLYSRSICAVPKVGHLLGQFIHNIPKVNLDLTQINGFSLGGHIAGYAGQEVRRLAGKKVGAIVGMDAAGPGFLGNSLEDRLDASDAEFVQGIHTSNTQFGYTMSYGTADFHVNALPGVGCGVYQPGCPLDPGIPLNDVGFLGQIIYRVFCNHIRAAAYFTESINSTNFRAQKCPGCGKEPCKSARNVVMGDHCPFSAKGDYYLHTNDQPPYAKGDGMNKI